MYIMHDPRIFEKLLHSNDEDDNVILTGILEAHWYGKAQIGILDFRKIRPGNQIVYNIRGEKCKIGVSVEIAKFLEKAAQIQNEHC